MTEEFIYETSFRFKWGCGFFIEFLTATLKDQATPPTCDYTLELENFAYDAATQEFVETDAPAGALATPTNFVLHLSKEHFDALVPDGNQVAAALKGQLITEFAEEATDEASTKRLALLHDTYDTMPILDAILTYTQLQLNWVDDQYLVIHDPQPQKQNPAHHLIG